MIQMQPKHKARWVDYRKTTSLAEASKLVLSALETGLELGMAKEDETQELPDGKSPMGVQILPALHDHRGKPRSPRPTHGLIDTVALSENPVRKELPGQSSTSSPASTGAMAPRAPYPIPTIYGDFAVMSRGLCEMGLAELPQVDHRQRT